MAVNRVMSCKVEPSSGSPPNVSASKRTAAIIFKCDEADAHDVRSDTSKHPEHLNLKIISSHRELSKTAFMTISSKVTRRVGDIKWSTYTKWAGAEAEDDEMTLTFVLEDIARMGYGLEGDWFCFPKYVGLEVEKNQWLTMGDDPEELILRTTLKVVSLRLFPEKCGEFWKQTERPAPNKVSLHKALAS